MTDGIPYFPFDVNQDEKIELIEAEYGLAGFAVIVKLYQKIYGGFGYYTPWTKDTLLLFSKKIGLEQETVSSIVNALIKRGVFDEKLYKRYKILTSMEIQSRFFEITRRRKKFEVKKEYILIDVNNSGENVNNLSENVDNSVKNVDNFKQSKVKESKGKYSKEKKVPSAQNKFCNYKDTNQINYDAHKAKILSAMLDDS